MRKFFTLIAMALIAMGANAQVLFDGTESTSNGLTNGGVAVAFVTDTYTFVEDAKKNGDLTAVGYWSGKNNPKVGTKNYSASMTSAPDNGSVLLLTPDENGTLSVYVVVNANKAIYVLEDGAQINFSVSDEALEPGAKLAEKKSFVPVTFEVTAGKTYAVFCAGSKMGFYGYNLVVPEPEVVPAEPVTINVDFSQFNYAAGSMGTSTPVTEENGFNFIGYNSKVTLNKGGFYTGGSSTAKARHISFTPKYSGTLTVTATPSGDNTDRFVAIADAAKTPAKDGSDVLAYTMMPTKGVRVNVSYDLQAGTTYYVLLYGNGSVTGLSYTYTPATTKDEIKAFYEWFLQCATALNKGAEFKDRDLAAEYKALADPILKGYKAGEYAGKMQLAKDELATAFVSLFKGTSMEALAKMYVLQAEGNNVATGIENVATSTSRTGKFIQNGRVVIVKNGKTYSTTGALLK